MIYIFRTFTLLFTFKHLALAGLVLSAIPVTGQQQLFTNQQHFGVEEGLPQSYVSGITQDKDGFIWIATLDGLCRYDGRGFKTIRYKVNDSTSLSANSINNISQPVNNTVTLHFSPFQADEINLQTFKISRHTIRNKLSTIPNSLWQTCVSNTPAYTLFRMADSKGIGWMEHSTGKIAFANVANGRLERDTVSALTQGSDGKAYLVSPDGVHVSDARLQQFRFYPFSTLIKPQALRVYGDAYQEYYSIVSLPHNRLALADEGKIIILDILKMQTTVLNIPEATTGVQASSNMLQVDSKGRLYFIDHGRVFRKNDNHHFKLLWENSINPGLRISSLFIDRSDVLWVSVNAQGLSKIDLQARPFESYKYKINFMSDIMQLASGPQLQLQEHWKNIEGSFYFRQAKDSKANIYACFNWYNHNDIYQLTKEGTRVLTHKPSKGSYSALYTTPQDELWAYDLLGSNWYRWKTPESVPEKIPMERGSMTGIELADAKYVGGFTWLSTYNHGLLKYEGIKKIKQFSGKTQNGFMPETLTEICPDPLDKSKIWIGSRGGGLVHFDVRKGLERVYTVDDGLPNNTIYCILPDSFGNLWCSTNKGIFRLNLKTKQITSFEKTDGLPGNEFNRAHKFIMPDGRLVFGGLDGYTIFNPADFNVPVKEYEVPILLTALYINNLSWEKNANSLQTNPLSTLKKINLPYNKNYLRFEFAAMIFNQPQKTRYRYQLQGADKDWIDNGTANSATYSALRPGNYVFRMNATDNNGQWSKTVNELNVTIKPPFWFTWWAYIIYVLIALALIRWYFVFREKQLRTEQDLAFETREAHRLKELDEIKDRFFSNVTHEFRTPLTLIVSPLESLLRDNSLSSTARRTVETINRNSHQLLTLINEFLDFSKLKDGGLKLKLAHGDLCLFTANCVEVFETVAREKNIELAFSSSGADGHYMFDEEKWGKIVSNLLSNAMKFTPAHGKVSVTLSGGHGNLIKLEVTDNGPGIELDQQRKIFDRFYQIDDSPIRNVGGTGIGLSLVKELCELMQGHISLESKPGGPTTFVVQLPLEPISNARLQKSTNPLPIESALVSPANLPVLLIAEDNDELRAFLSESLRPQYQILEAADGLQAWDLILQEIPDLIISDVMMPGQDGFDLCRLCKADKRTSHIGFILLTSKAAHDARLKGLETGADDYITKPFNLEELLLRMANLMHLLQHQRDWLRSQLISASPNDQRPVLTDPFLLELYEKMDEKLDDADLGVEYLSKAMAMSRSTLNRKLKAILNTSANDLIRQYRLQKATTILMSGSDISTVAYQVGFSSPSYFSQCFREAYGITPSDYVSSQN